MSPGEQLGEGDHQPVKQGASPIGVAIVEWNPICLLIMHFVRADRVNGFFPDVGQKKARKKSQNCDDEEVKPDLG
jgi:hypothetical protein